MLRHLDKSVLIFYLGEDCSGRYVIVQMDNGVGVPLNLKEVRAFGANGETVGAKLKIRWTQLHVRWEGGEKKTFCRLRLMRQRCFVFSLS